MSFSHRRRIHFADTDAAGVVFFARYLAICHEAYEEALRAEGIDLNRFFGEEGIIIPIASARCDYLRPLHCGDEVEVRLSPTRTAPAEFTLDHEMVSLSNAGKTVARARTTHVCIDSATRRRKPLPEKFAAWTGEVVVAGTETGPQT